MKKLIIAAVAALCLGTENTQAQFLDGNQLYSLCTAPKNNFSEFGELLGYVMSSADTLGNACFPPNVIAGQLKDVVCKHLKAEPEKRQLPAIVLSSFYLAQSFPCPNNTKPQ